MPGSQLTQARGVSKPSVIEDLPDSQCVQATAPELKVYVPLGQLKQVAVPLSFVNVPA